MTSSTAIDLDRLAAILEGRRGAERDIVAIAGPPGSGKSTTSDRLAEALNASSPGSAAVFPMDGYHYDDAILSARGWRPRKGAPHTFDVGGFAAMLSRLRANEEPEIAIPVFDRSIEVSRNSARIIPSSVKTIIAEGNYLLLDEPPWRALSDRFDLTVFLDIPIETLRARLEYRWRDMTPADRAEKLNENDLPNVEHVISQSRPADYVIRG